MEPTSDTRVVRRVLDLVRTDPRVRTRHLMVQVQQDHVLEIGGRVPPWWSHVVNLPAARRDPHGYALRMVDAWAASVGV